MPNDRFLNRWSRMKAKARPQRGIGGSAAAVASYPEEGDFLEDTALREEDDIQELAPVVQDAAPVEFEPELSEEELVEKANELGLPSLDSLGPGSDFKAFMASTVPAQLRNLALQKLWRSNPVLANLDGLIDYGDDFTDAGTVVVNMQTAYQVGRGYKRDPVPDTLDEEDLDGMDQDQIASDEEAQDPETEDDHAAREGEDSEAIQKEDSANDQDSLDEAVQMAEETPQKVGHG
ncbi:DUF3306 domain-containing protein [Hwanghaeella sp. 1Z406]|uniref:DUF3306 domain-containing protein n=1 Tax=Hwanghaeella sp. 1Z406 TaxID=3402811 RepID=UPI0026A25BB5